MFIQPNSLIPKIDFCIIRFLSINISQHMIITISGVIMMILIIRFLCILSINIISLLSFNYYAKNVFFTAALEALFGNNDECFLK